MSLCLALLSFIFLQKIDRILFAGNFLRVNKLSARLLAFALDFWSNGRLKALFLRHEGYFGAVGCLTQLMRSSEARRLQKMNGVNKQL